MSGGLDQNDGARLAIRLITEAASSALVELLQTKHLYQKVAINYEKTLATTRDSVLSAYHAKFQSNTFRFRNEKFEIAEKARTSVEAVGMALLLQNLKLFCQKCDSAEAFTPLWHRELTGEILATKVFNPTLEIPLLDRYQAFVLAYQCQICKSDPVIFLVRRHKWNLILDGRSPMEQVQVPNEIPKDESGFFRDGIIAYQSGKSLAGILYLRVFLEAFARRQTGQTTRMNGDDLMDAYAKLLPLEKRSLMPSLKEWYGKLSEAIHAGSEDGDLFKEASAAIHEHFEFRRLFAIADVTAKVVEEGLGADHDDAAQGPTLTQLTSS